MMQGDYRATMASLNELKTLRDSLFSGDTVRAMVQIESKYEIDKEERILSLLNQNLVREQYGRWLLLCVVSLLIVLLLAGIWIYRQSRKTNRLLSDQKQAIEDQAVELYELNQTKDKLFTLLGHELRVPIISLKSTLTLFESNTLTPDNLRQYMSRLRSEIDQYYPMLDNLIHWSLSQQHGLFAVPRVLCLHELTDEVLCVLERLTITKNITIVNRLQPAAVLADENHVRIVVRNVLHNALKFTPVGGTIALDLILEDGYAGVMIQDSGRGISAEMLARLFQKLSVWPGTAGEKGTGLGLKLCRELVLLNNGHPRVYSNPENGTQVLCLFPVNTSLISEFAPEELAGTHA